MGELMNPAELQVNAQSFHRAISNMLLAASKDTTREHLCSVLFSWSGDTVCLTATDGYVLLRETVSIKNDAGASTDVLVSTDRLKSLLRALGKPSGQETLTLSYADDTLQTAHPSGTVNIPVALPASAFPNVSNILPTWKNEGREYAHLALNPKFIGVLSKLKVAPEEAGIPIKMQPGVTPQKPVMFQLGERITALIQPTKAA